MSKRMDELAKRSRFRIGDFDVHPDRCAIIKDGKETSLDLLIMGLLVELAENYGKVVSREMLLERVWKNKELDDNPIHKAFVLLRKALGDDATNPQYIKTVRSGGYRLIPKPVFEKHYRGFRRHERSWFSGSPYVGLKAFDEDHTDVFFGRERMREKVLKAMRAQFESGSRFVLLHGASGSGKTSLLNAGVIPRLKNPGSQDDLRALAVTRCDLASAQSGDALGAVAVALAAWTLGDHPVFPLQSLEELKNLLIETPESIEHIVHEAFQRYPDRKAANHPLAHLLLVIDHGEKLVDTTQEDTQAYERFSRALTALCGSERILTVMIVRSDFYQKLQEALPDIMELKGSQGHIDVMRPSPREIADMIRAPAECAGIDFEHDAETGDHLDDRLREDASGKPDVLPLLQHTLNQLYENRNQEKNLLTFAAYNEMGGLEGGIAHRAEEIFTELPPDVQASLDDVLSLLVEVQDTGVVTGKKSSLDSLDSNGQNLVKAFIDARLFASEKDDHHHPRFGVTHEALLRRWPKASEWSKKNLRLLKAHTDLKNATDRWSENGRKKDHLLNPGIPLVEALEVAKRKRIPLRTIETEYIAQSNKQRKFNIAIRRLATSGLVFLSIASVWMSLLAKKSQEEAERQRDMTSLSNALLIGEVADRLDPTADIELIEKISRMSLTFCYELNTEIAKLDELITCSRAFRKLGKIHLFKSEIHEAIKSINLSVFLSRKAVAKQNKSKSALNEAGQAVAWLGKAYQRTGALEKAVEAWEDYLRISNNLVKYHHSDPESHIQKSYALTNLGSAEIERKNYAKAIKYFSDSRSIKEKVISELKQPNLEYEYELAVTISFICNVYAKTSRLKEASECYANQELGIQKLIDQNPSANDWKRQLANLMQLHARVEINQKNIEGARKTIKNSINQLILLSSKEEKNATWATYLSQAYILASEIEKNAGDISKCEIYMKLASDKMALLEKTSISWNRTYDQIKKRKSSCYSK